MATVAAHKERMMEGVSVTWADAIFAAGFGISLGLMLAWGI